MYEYSATALRVVDGDTVKLVVDMGFGVHVVETFRLLRINAPEMRTPEGPPARLALEVLTLGVKLRIKTTKREKYGRWLAEIFSAELNINDEMVRLGHAIHKEY